MLKLPFKLKCVPDNNYILRYVYPVSVFLGTLMLLGVMLFLYRNVYETLAQAELVNDLKAKVAQENLNLNKFNEIIDKMKNKSSCTEINSSELRDPTVFVERAPTQPEQQQSI